MSVTQYDHLAITVSDIERTTAFYVKLFGARTGKEYAPQGKVLHRQLFIGGAKMNLHQHGNGVELVADKPTPGAVDVCFRWDQPIETVVALLARHGIPITDGPSPRQFSDGRDSVSVYFRDPDGNLVELMAAR
jgi:catechol 2,3-dioxygenase-like lactoylglutathione lyase family enzyme